MPPLEEYRFTDADGGQWLVSRQNGPMGIEILRLAAREREHETFVAGLIGALGLTREAIELSATPVGNVLLEIVRGLAGNRSALCRKCCHPRYEHRETGCDFCVEIDVSQRCLAFKPIVQE